MHEMPRIALPALVERSASLEESCQAPKASDVKTPVDKAQMEAWARHLFVWGEGIDVTVSDPEPSTLPGFSKVTVKGSVGKQSQEELFLVSADGQNIIRGSAYSVAQNPFKPELALLDTKDQPGLGTPGARW